MVSRLMALLLLLLPTVSHAWWNDEWKFRKKLTLDTTPAAANIANSLVDAPLLVRLHTGNFAYFLDIKPDGSDLRFVAGDDLTPLKYHIEKLDVANEMALIWVRVPQVLGANGTQNIWMYYGNPTAMAGADRGGTYDSGQSLVYHFDGSGGVSDATGFQNQPAVVNALIAPASLIGPGVRFEGNNQIQLMVSHSLRVMPVSGWTWSAWVKINQPQADAVLFEIKDGARAASLRVDNTVLYARVALTAGTQETQKTNLLSPGAWHHVALSLTQTGLLLYINGNAAASLNLQLEEIGGTLAFGGSADASEFFTGEMDEVQVAATARSADWVRAQYAGQSLDTRLIGYGNDEQNQGSGSNSYFGVILQNVTVDGWVVITVLMIMAMISWFVMLTKGLFIRRVRRDNRSFIDAFKRLGKQDPAVLDQAPSAEETELAAAPVTLALFGKHDHYQSSPLYHIYHAGIEEVQRRVGKAVGAQAASLSPQAVATLRAELDATTVRETQKLNGLMVLLTIAISGGPFLGLLGTVVGVMITFAAIAATGDVNINAIAPGIAAALVATVAGLAVAIPALFGYNYIASRIKEIVADMHVFVDEFVTKIAEHYS